MSDEAAWLLRYRARLAAQLDEDRAAASALAAVTERTEQHLRWVDESLAALGSQAPASPASPAGVDAMPIVGAVYVGARGGRRRVTRVFRKGGHLRVSFCRGLRWQDHATVSYAVFAKWLRSAHIEGAATAAGRVG